MNTIRRGAFIALVALLTITILPVAALAQFSTLDSVVAHYLKQRPEMAPLIPPLQPSILKTIEGMIRKSDYSFQEWEDWYAGWGEGVQPAEGELADYRGQTLVVFEDLSQAAILIMTTEGKLVATFDSEPFPDFSTLKGVAADNAFLEELNLRSLMFWISVESASAAPAASSAILSGSGGGGMMMSMGGSNAFEVVEIGQTNTGMAVTFAWPATFTNRVDIYSFDGGDFTGRVSWTLADVGYVTAGTNQLRWIDTGQLGRALSSNTSVRFYAAGDADLDADSDGYGNTCEYLVLHTIITNGDTDGDYYSDGPFDPDNTGPIVAGPDAFPLDPNEWLDTDGDDICDNSDPDIDGDGILNGSDASPLIPVNTAPVKTVMVETNKPAGDDSGTEVFDMTSAGRMLPYASGSDANHGFGSIHGGIYFCYDETNLYVSVAGYNSGESDGLMIFIDTDVTSGGAAGLANLSGSPAGFGTANNLLFNSSTFTPDVGILVGHRYGDGQNYHNFNFNGVDIGQGVYALTPTTISDFPGFSTVAGSPISQWGDRDNNPPNAGIEIALALTNLNLSVSNTFKAAAIVFSNSTSGGNRYFSGEAYGSSVSGTLSSGNFGFNTVTLIGAPIYMSSASAPEAGGAPPFTDDDVMLQGYIWDVPGFIQSMSVAGSFNGWDAGAEYMTLTGYTEWEYIKNFDTPTSGATFKFAANGSWDLNWGDNNQSAGSLPIVYKQADQGGTDIAIPGTVSGYVRFRFNSSSGRYTILNTTGSVTADANTTTNFWYNNLAAKSQAGDLDKFTMIWMPPPKKGNSGIQSVGYDPFDYYDLGTYNEKGTVKTRYGGETELKSCVDTLRGRGIRPIVDLVLNHIQNGASGADKFRFTYANHNTFEKLDPGGDNGNQYFNDSTNNAPFHYEYDFGRDVNFEHPYQRQGIKSWGDWITAKVGYQGYRWDLAFNIDPWFISEFMRSGLKQDRFSVMEYWEKETEGTSEEMMTYLALTDYRSAMFDMPLRDCLKDMCNLSGAAFNISNLTQKGLVNHAPQWAVTFAESHDTIRPYGPENPPKVGITKDKGMAYAFVLMSAGLPMVSYNDYFIGKNADPAPPDDSVDDGWTGGTLKTQIDQLVDIRKNYAGGETSYLYADSDLLIMKRVGNDQKLGCILTLNDNDSTPKSANINTGWPQGTVLVDALQPSHTVTVQPGGMATLSASNRAYRVYIQE
jgi:alpha-amylase